MQMLFRTCVRTCEGTETNEVGMVGSDVLPREGDYVSLPGEKRTPYRVKSVAIKYIGNETSAVVYVHPEVG